MSVHKVVIFQQVPLFAGLTVEKGYPTGQVLSREGEPCSGLFLTAQGTVKIYKTLGVGAGDHAGDRVHAVQCGGSAAVRRGTRSRNRQRRRCGYPGARSSSWISRAFSARRTPSCNRPAGIYRCHPYTGSGCTVTSACGTSFWIARSISSVSSWAARRLWLPSTRMWMSTNNCGPE